LLTIEDLAFKSGYWNWERERERQRDRQTEWAKRNDLCDRPLLRLTDQFFYSKIWFQKDVGMVVMPHLLEMAF
jgi:hypothetical protein